MTRHDYAFGKVVFGLTWVFIILYGSYNIGVSITRHQWPKPMIIVGGVVIVLGGVSVAFWTWWRRNAQENKKPAVPAERPPAQKASPRVTYRGNSVYVQGRPKAPF